MKQEVTRMEKKLPYGPDFKQPKMEKQTADDSHLWKPTDELVIKLASKYGITPEEQAAEMNIWW